MDLTNERVLVTGGSGFLGSFVCERLHEIGCSRVFVPRSADYNLVEKKDVRDMYREFSPTVVIHLAAVVGGIRVNKDKQGEFFYKNLMMGIQLLEEARKTGLKKFVAIGTSCGYPKDLSAPFSEDEFWNGYPEETNAPYGMSKKMMLVQAKAYEQQYDFQAIHLIPANFFGPRDDFDLYTSHVIPALIRKFTEAKERKDKVNVWGTGNPTRDFLYVTDAAEAIVKATRDYSSTDPVNIASGKEISISNLAKRLKEIIGFDGELHWDETKSDGRPRVCLDTSRAKKKFNFEFTTEFEKGLVKTVDWFQANQNKILKQPSVSGFRTELPSFICTTPPNL